MKDTDNLLSYALWSAGDYDDTIPSNLTLTNNISVIGDFSWFHKQPTPASWWYFMIQLLSTVSTDTLYTFSLNVYCPDANYTIRIHQNNSVLTSLRIVQSNRIQEISISCTTTSTNSLSVSCINNTDDSSIYIDNLKLTTS